MVSGKLLSKVGTSINTVSGKATYSHTEIEDQKENWDDHWTTKNGEYVIHAENQHHVYIVKN